MDAGSGNQTVTGTGAGDLATVAAGLDVSGKLPDIHRNRRDGTATNDMESLR